MTKQEKLDIKLLMTGIKDSILDSQWDNIVDEFPFILQYNDDIEDDIVVEPPTTELPSVERGKRSIRASSDDCVDNSDIDSAFETLKDRYNITFDPIKGVAMGVEQYVGAYIRTGEIYFRKYSDSFGGDGALAFCRNEDEAAYLRTLGYKPLSELWKNQCN